MLPSGEDGEQSGGEQCGDEDGDRDAGGALGHEGLLLAVAIAGVESFGEAAGLPRAELAEPAGAVEAEVGQEPAGADLPDAGQCSQDGVEAQAAQVGVGAPVGGEQGEQVGVGCVLEPELDVAAARVGGSRGSGQLLLRGG